MSMRLMVDAMSTKVGNPLTKLVLIKLADNANDEGMCYPSYSHIAAQCEISKRSAMTHMSKLVDMGLVLIEHRKIKGNFNKSNIYKLKIGKSNIKNEPSSLIGSEARSLGGGETHSLGVVNHVHPEPVTYEPVIIESVNEPIVDQKISFNDFWEKYPKKQNEIGAKIEFGKLDESQYSLVMDGLHKMLTNVKHKYFPFASNFLKFERWRDVYLPYDSFDNGKARKTKNITIEEQLNDISWAEGA